MELPPDDINPGLTEMTMVCTPVKRKKRMHSPKVEMPADVLQDALQDDEKVEIPPDVLQDELDDIFADIAQVSPSKEHRRFARARRGSGKHGRKPRKNKYPGPSAATIMKDACQWPQGNVAGMGIARRVGHCEPDDVLEIFSPPRILLHTQRLGLRGNLSADLMTGWNLSLKLHQDNLLWEIHRRRPKLVFLEPPCTWFSKLLNLKWDKMPRHVREEAFRQAIRLLEFALKVMCIQLLAGRAFVLEHPAGATSRGHPGTVSAKEDYPNVGFADFDFCMFGMVTTINRTPVKKQTRLTSNCRQVLRRFANVGCDRTHPHEVCMGQEGA